MKNLSSPLISTWTTSPVNPLRANAFRADGLVVAGPSRPFGMADDIPQAQPNRPAITRDTSAPSPKPAPPRKKRRWLRWVGYAFGALFALLLLAVVLHAPLLRFAVKWAAQHYAQGEKIAVTFEIEGDPWSELILTNVQANATGDGAPITSAKIGRLRATYDLIAAYRTGLADLLHDVELRDADILVETHPDPAKKDSGLPTSLPTIPFPRSLDLQRVNLVVREAGSTLTSPPTLKLHDFSLGLFPDRPGAISATEIIAGDLAPVKDFHAGTTYARNTLALLAPSWPEFLHETNLRLDFSDYRNGSANVMLDGLAGGSPITIFAAAKSTGADIQIEAHASAHGTQLVTLNDFFPAQRVTSGVVDKIELAFSGLLNNRPTWKGGLDATVSDLGVILTQKQEQAVAGAAQTVGATAAQATAAAPAVSSPAQVASNAKANTAAAPDSTAPKATEPPKPRVRTAEPAPPPSPELLPLPGTSGANMPPGMTQNPQAPAATPTPIPGKPESGAAPDALPLPTQSPVTNQKVTDPSAPPALVPPIAPGPKEIHVQTTHLVAALASGQVDLKSLQLNLDGTNAIGATGSFNLNTMSDYALRLEMRAPVVAKLEPVVRQWVPGSALGGDFSFSYEGTGTGDLSSPAAHTGRLLAHLENAVYDEFRLLTFDLESTIAAGRVTIQRGEARLDEANRILVQGSGDVVAPFSYQTITQLDFADLSKLASMLKTWLPDLAAAGKLNATWEGHGSGKLESPDAHNGTLTLRLENGAYQSARLKSLDLTAALESGSVDLTRGALVIDDANRLDLQAKADLHEPHAYRGNANVAMADLSKLAPLLETWLPKTSLAGKMNATWEGSGTGTDFKPGAPHTGKLNLTLVNGAYQDYRNLNATIQGEYDPAHIALPVFRASMNRLRVETAAQWQNKRLVLTDTGLWLGERRLLTGKADFPIDLVKPEDFQKWVQAEDEVAIDFRLDPLELQSLNSELPKPLPIAGKVEGQFIAKGKLSALEASVHARADGLRSPDVKDLQPAALKLDLTLKDNLANLDALVTQPQMQPLTVRGKMPFNAAATLGKATLDKDAPIDLVATLPPTSLAVVKQFVPAISEIDGHASLNLTVKGTVGDPQMKGLLDVGVPVLRMAQRAIPALRNVVARVAFDEKAVRIEQCGGEIAGGPFRLTGGALLPTLTTPTVDMHLTGKDVLLVRDDSVLVRADPDITIKGPFEKANVSGSIGLVKSRFFKEIDILPIGLPGSPAPKVQASVLPAFTIPTPPLKDWTFNLAIKTKDPFQVEGNLAYGKIDINLLLTGTGEKPVLNGTVVITNLEAALPFSRMHIQGGSLTFNASTGLNALMHIDATSEMRDYAISIRIYGTLLDPEVLMTSQPPLAQEDIVSLIATGATTKELTGSSTALAGKASYLLAQKLYRSVFGGRQKRFQPPPDDLNSRFTLDTGGSVGVGPTGGDTNSNTSAVGASYRINNNWQIVADVGISGGFRVRGRYLLRFR